MNTYRFEIPTEISYCVDESNLSIDNLKDIKKLEKIYDVDLDFVIDEYEYKIEMEDEASEDEDYIRLTKSEVFNMVINELWNDIIEILNYSVKFNSLEENIVNQIYKITSNNFNNSHLEKYFNRKNDLGIISISMNGFDIDNSVLYVDVNTNRELSNSEIDEICKYIDGQCSDGWGEGFEQQDISSQIGEEDKYVYVRTWNSNTEVKFIK